MENTIKRLSEEEFEIKFELVINHIERANQPSTVADEDICSFSGCMYETFGEELDFVREMAKQNRVITIIETDCEDCDEEDGYASLSMYYVSGYHFVNRIGYLITTEPITEEFEVLLEW